MFFFKLISLPQNLVHPLQERRASVCPGKLRKRKEPLPLWWTHLSPTTTRVLTLLAVMLRPSRATSWTRKPSNLILYITLVRTYKHSLLGFYNTCAMMRFNRKFTDNVLTLRPSKIDVEFNYSSEEIRRNLALHHLLTNGSSAVNGCRQSPNSW